ncbi:MAG TPA: anti-sigma factor [Gemmatimonadaceae bacterium]|nr:anti-sigma factor [Gemmatimonadaceae bacterium]
MSERMEHTWLEQTAPYALGALDERDRVAFETHLATCDICAAEVRELSEVASLLATAAAHVAPPPALRDRIMSDARNVRPISAADQPVNTLAPGAARVPAEPPPRAKGGGGRSVLPWIAAIAASVAAVFLGLQYRGERTARATAEQALAIARVTMDSTGARLAQRDSLIALLVAPDVQAVSVTGTGPSPSARYFLDRRANRIVIAASALPPAASGRTYQLWGIETGKPPVGLGTFNTDANGRALVSLTVPAGLRIAVTAVTDEPTGGSPLPTTTPFLAATWKSE